MKFLLSTALLASVLAVPAVSFAQQSNAPITRAQVRAELVAAQKAGLLNQNDTNYPKVDSAQTFTTASVTPQQNEAVGGVSDSKSQAGSRPAPENGIFATYRGN
ncbi:DUF4148 domain-containing protein [Paraburkholderia saeva]|uniref:DUF4148 domain-containing protein n=1 Tax=Paraburkholderia saeva TaxID=2777537 RepID=A0A9N8S363_9BURK|nr:DUF4148 domain-containing protein [Paraburkholderia saeva]CAG4926083.1 hypothetical protein R52603_05438 [Paraburkholderia saeva]CAG4927469.1 hypothetical protein R70241_05595 [Paraburkholderia saeva]CAG4927557.1 hypothetical protein LMG31841_05707 [Paraburkholderia saeva]